MDLVVHTVTKDVVYIKSQGAPFDFLYSIFGNEKALHMFCLLYTSDAADE